jgi:RNA polymerase sigma factor (TIGR02999 family)
VTDEATPAMPVDKLVDAVYGELRRIAHAHRRGESLNLTLRTTALVHEAYLRLAQDNAVAEPRDAAHLKALTSRIIRHVLVDYARRRNAAKRDPAQAADQLPPDCVIEPSLNVELLDLDAAIHKLTRRSPQLGQIVEYRFFGGLNAEETAKVMGLSSRTVERGWRSAKAILLSYLEPKGSSG